MTQAEIDNAILELGNVGIALSRIEVKGENNLNFLLASIQTVRKVKNTLEGREKRVRHDDNDEQGENV